MAFSPIEYVYLFAPLFKSGSIHSCFSKCGFEGTVLKWFEEYHRNRSQITVVDSVKLNAVSRNFGAPQGSIMGPEDYKVYTLLVGDISRRNSLEFHGYADDSDNYIAFKLNDTNDLRNFLQKVTCALKQIKSWMTSNKLKLNDAKTEVLIMVPRVFKNQICVTDITIGDALVQPVNSARNVGVICDSNMLLDQEMTSRCKTCLYHLRHIRLKRFHLTQESCEKLLHALVSSRIDYANVILVGLPKYQLHKLQRKQNRIETKTPKFDNITPVLKKLHWLPMEERVKYKVATLTFRAIRGMAPENISNLISTQTRRAPFDHAKKIVLVTRKSRTKTYGDRTFSSQAPTIWNALPHELRNETDCIKFKKQLKTHYFKTAYK